MLNGKRLQHEFVVGDVAIVEKAVRDTLDWLEGRLPMSDECDDRQEELDELLSRELKLKGGKKRWAKMSKMSRAEIRARVHFIENAFSKE
eukprot:15229573-Alexandrium_andersonii.AAC.1